jgi:hypothetical protein
MGKRYEGLAKLATVFAAIFGISLGLCGATYLAADHVGVVAIPFGILELLGMAIGLVGLIVVVMSALVQWIGSLRAKDEEAE